MAHLKLPQETYSRMNGLASIKNMKSLNYSLDWLIYEWLKEGFDESDIRAFISIRVNEIIEKNK